MLDHEYFESGAVILIVVHLFKIHYCFLKIDAVTKLFTGNIKNILKTYAINIKKPLGEGLDAFLVSVSHHSSPHSASAL